MSSVPPDPEPGTHIWGGTCKGCETQLRRELAGYPRPGADGVWIRCTCGQINWATKMEVPGDD